MKKVLFAMFFCAILSIGATAHAFWIGDVNDGYGNWVTDVMGFDWSSSGSGLATTLGPWGTVPTTQPFYFDFYYQANLVGVTDPAGQPLTFPDLNSTFEYTVVAKVSEKGWITPNAILPNVYDGLFLTTGGEWYMYNDTNPNSNVASGFGFDDGTLVASGSIDPNQITTFQANLNTNLGIGSTTLFGLVDYKNPAYLDIASIIFDFRIEGMLNYPPLDSTTLSFFDGRAGEGNLLRYPNTGNIPITDLKLKVDGSSKFSVPEPSTMLLMGAGLLGLGMYGRRRIKK